MHVSTIIEKLKMKNVKYEHSSTQLGICLGKHVWHWFTHLPDGRCVVFDHSYSQNTGRSNSSLSQRLAVYRSLNKKLGIEI